MEPDSWIVILRKIMKLNYCVVIMKCFYLCFYICNVYLMCGVIFYTMCSCDVMFNVDVFNAAVKLEMPIAGLQALGVCASILCRGNYYPFTTWLQKLNQGFLICTHASLNMFIGHAWLHPCFPKYQSATPEFYHLYLKFMLIWEWSAVT